MSNKGFYLTTPLYYVNDLPHIGHAYTTIAADILARFNRMQGRDVYFLTGTDEHGQKILKASLEANQEVNQFVDSVMARFNELWLTLDITFDDFIRTTQARHIKTVEKVLNLLQEKNDLELKEYEGWYCTPCETFWQNETICPDCKRGLEKISEKNYFFKLSKYQDWLTGYIKEHPDFIRPKTRCNEVLGFLNNNKLSDLCISRPRQRLSWGIPIPFSPEHVTYVWFDALINYISAVGFVDNAEKFKQFWPADVQIIGKDILRQHAIYWPIILHALDLELPRMVFAHGWWTMSGEKMSKSRGNIVRPGEVVEKYGRDVLRYFLMREVPFGSDGVYSEDAVILRFNSDLANDLGNLVHRTLTMVEKYFNANVPQPGAIAKEDEALVNKARSLPQELKAMLENLDFSGALTSIWELINIANKYIENTAPWKVAKANDTKRLETIIYNLTEILRIVAISVYPFMPQTAESIASQISMEEKLEKINFDKFSRFGMIKPGTVIKKGGPLFPRIEK